MTKLEEYLHALLFENLPEASKEARQKVQNFLMQSLLERINAV